MGSMTSHAPQVLRSYLLRGRISSRGCLRATRAQHQDIPVSSHGSIQSFPAQFITTAANHSTSSAAFEDATVPYRKQLKEKAKKRKTANGSASVTRARSAIEHNDRWELTVGIEIHAQLNTAKKLFSTAASTINEAPNTQVALFDLAIPGSQPQFQRETLIPALRAALALNCTIQRKSQFDRKHYFHWDQPAGYQITQYYQPFAREGHITLYAHDGIAKEDGEELRVGIKQIQMEQDTAKTIAQPGDLHLLDFNRVGVPLIEIITLPDIHYPSTAAALVRKVQAILNTVDACVLGMELGGLRADVNVSVRRRDLVDVNAHHGYAGVSGLGQRTEIKNLSSFKAVRDAIIAERDRQIEVLEGGGIIAGETRGWNLGSTETKRLRGKEGEVDYRYMPDPDLAPVIVGDDLISHLKQSLGMLPDEEMQLLTGQYGLTTKDALSLVALEDGGRVEYFYNVVDELSKLNLDEDCPKKFGRICGNWVLHELGGVLKDTPSDPNALQIDFEGNCVVPAEEMAQIINHLELKLITGNTAKNLLLNIFNNAQHGVVKTVVELIEEGSLLLRPMSDAEYRELAESVMEPSIVEQILKGQEGKMMHLVGQMMRHGEQGRVEPQEAARIVRAMIEERRT